MFVSSLCWDADVFETEFFRVQLMVFRWLGHIASKNDSFKYFNLLRGFFNIGVYLFVLIAEVIFLLYGNADITTATLIAAIAIIYFNLLLKTIIFYMNSTAYQSLFSDIQIGLESSLSDNNKLIKNIFLSYQKNSKKFDVSFGGGLFCICTLVVLGGVIFVGINFRNIIQGSPNADVTAAFIYVGYPFRILFDNFFVVYILPCYSVFLGGTGVFYWTTLFTNFMRYASYRIDAVNDQLVRLTDNSDIGPGERYHCHAKNRLRECTKAVISVKKFVKNFEEISKIIMLVESTTSTALMCFLMYQILQIEDYSTAIITLPAVFSTLSILFVYYWNANEVKCKSDQVSFSAYLSRWYDLPVPVQKELLLFMKGCFNPMSISACLFQMNTQSFVLILKTSYSYLTLLTNVVNKDDV